MTVASSFSKRDLLFMVETLIPERSDKDNLVHLVREDAEFIEAMLNADRLFERLTADKEILLRISPRLFFTVLLKRARKDLEKETYTIERTYRQRIPVFDTNLVSDLLSRQEVPTYLAEMLASFTKTESMSIRVRVRQGLYHRYRFSDLDIDGLLRYAQALDEQQRFGFYKRIGDVCLFLSGIFPEHIQAQNQPWSTARRAPFWGERRRTMEEYREEGSHYYQRAAQHPAAQLAHLAETLALLGDHFLEAQKALSFVAERYLRFQKQQLFAIG